MFLIIVGFVRRLRVRVLPNEIIGFGSLFDRARLHDSFFLFAVGAAD